MINRAILKIFFPLIALGLLATGCGHTQTSPVPKIQTSKVGKKVVRVATSMVGRPYRYGGNNPRGFDCSGLVQYSYKRAGIDVPRNTRYQRRHSYKISQRQLKKGDLIFFNQEGKWASHVGIYIGKGRFVHAPSSGKRVRISSLQKRYWRRHLESIRRFNIRF